MQWFLHQAKRTQLSPEAPELSSESEEHLEQDVQLDLHLGQEQMRASPIGR